MIRIQYQPPDLLKMEIKMTIPQLQVFAFLQTKGYEIKPWLYQYQEETFPNGKTDHEVWTFTATKNNESQSEETIFRNVFEREIKNFLDQL